MERNCGVRSITPGTRTPKAEYRTVVRQGQTSAQNSIDARRNGSNTSHGSSLIKPSVVIQRSKPDFRANSDIPPIRNENSAPASVTQLRSSTPTPQQLKFSSTNSRVVMHSSSNRHNYSHTGGTDSSHNRYDNGSQPHNSSRQAGSGIGSPSPSGMKATVVQRISNPQYSLLAPHNKMNTSFDRSSNGSAGTASQTTSAHNSTTSNASHLNYAPPSRTNFRSLTPQQARTSAGTSPQHPNLSTKQTTGASSSSFSREDQSSRDQASRVVHRSYAFNSTSGAPSSLSVPHPSQFGTQSSTQQTYQNQQSSLVNGGYQTSHTNQQAFSQVRVGQVLHLQGKPAVVKFRGSTKFAPGVWIGVEFLREPAGRNDGTVAGVRYFYAKSNHGLFFKENSLPFYVSNPPNAGRTSDGQGSDVPSTVRSSYTRGSDDVSNRESNRIRESDQQIRESNLRTASATTNSSCVTRQTDNLLSERAKHNESLKSTPPFISGASPSGGSRKNPRIYRSIDVADVGSISMNTKSKEFDQLTQTDRSKQVERVSLEDEDPSLPIQLALTSRQKEEIKLSLQPHAQSGNYSTKSLPQDYQHSSNEYPSNQTGSSQHVSSQQQQTSLITDDDNSLQGSLVSSIPKQASSGSVRASPLLTCSPDSRGTGSEAQTPDRSMHKNSSTNLLNTSNIHSLTVTPTLGRTECSDDADPNLSQSGMVRFMEKSTSKETFKESTLTVVEKKHYCPGSSVRKAMHVNLDIGKRPDQVKASPNSTSTCDPSSSPGIVQTVRSLRTNDSDLGGREMVILSSGSDSDSDNDLIASRKSQDIAKEILEFQKQEKIRSIEQSQARKQMALLGKQKTRKSVDHGERNLMLQSSSNTKEAGTSVTRSSSATRIRSKSSKQSPSGSPAKSSREHRSSTPPPGSSSRKIRTPGGSSTSPRPRMAQVPPSPAGSLSPTTKALHEQNTDLWTRLEEEEEMEYLAENQTVTKVENYLQNNFPHDVRRTNNKLPTISESVNDWKELLGFPFDFNEITDTMVTAVVERVKNNANTPLPRVFVWTLVNKIETLYRKSYTSPLVKRTPPAEGRMVIVGDTHGQLEDLCWIFFKYGRPSPTNVYFFNGDMVDRGYNGCEILILMYLHQLWDPSCIHVNRGNHEDANMNERERSIGGGFAQECRGKYGNEIYQLIQKTFNLMPLGTVVSSKLLVIHGGLFRCPNVTLRHIQRVDRFRTCPEHPATVADWIFFDSLWADPNPGKSKGISKRGDDCFSFGSDTTNRFLKDNNLHMVVRSHELPANSRGFQVHHDSKLITIFSASNYCGTSGNYGAIMLLQSTLEFEIFEHWAPELQEILELEKESQLATKAVQEDLTKRKAIDLLEENCRHGTRRRSTVQLEGEILAKLKVKICEKKAELVAWYSNSGKTYNFSCNGDGVGRNSNRTSLSATPVNRNSSQLVCVGSMFGFFASTMAGRDTSRYSPRRSARRTSHEVSLKSPVAKDSSESDSGIQVGGSLELISLDSFIEGLSAVVGENVPWLDMVQRHLHVPILDSSRKGVDHLAFLRRFRVEAEGINDFTWRRDAISSVYNAILNAHLPLRQLFALFDHNLSGVISLKAFQSVMNSFELGLSMSQLQHLYQLITNWGTTRTGLAKMVKQFEIPDGGKGPEDGKLSSTSSPRNSNSTNTGIMVRNSAEWWGEEGFDDKGNVLVMKNHPNDDPETKKKEEPPPPLVDTCCIADFIGNFNSIYRRLCGSHVTIIGGDSSAKANLGGAGSTSSSDFLSAPHVSDVVSTLHEVRSQLTVYLEKQISRKSTRNAGDDVSKNLVQAQFLQLFESADQDQDGLLSYTEFMNLIYRISGSNEGASHMIETSRLRKLAEIVDISKTGKISYTEFLFLLAPSEEDELTISGTTPLKNVTIPINSNVFNILSPDEGKYDAIVTLLYGARRSLRKALQYFDTDSTYLIDKKHLKYALQGLIVALNNNNSTTRRTTTRQLSQPEIEAFVAALPCAPGTKNMLDYNVFLDSFLVVDMNPGQTGMVKSNSTLSSTASNASPRYTSGAGSGRSNHDGSRLHGSTLGLHDYYLAPPKVWKKRCSTLTYPSSRNSVTDLINLHKTKMNNLEKLKDIENEDKKLKEKAPSVDEDTLTLHNVPKIVETSTSSRQKVASIVTTPCTSSSIAANAHGVMQTSSSNSSANQSFDAMQSSSTTSQKKLETSTTKVKTRNPSPRTKTQSSSATSHTSMNSTLYTTTYPASGTASSIPTNSTTTPIKEKNAEISSRNEHTRENLPSKMPGVAPSTSRIPEVSSSTIPDEYQVRDDYRGVADEYSDVAGESNEESNDGLLSPKSAAKMLGLGSTVRYAGS